MGLRGDALDALSGDTFDAVYEEAIKPELEALETQRRQALALFAGTVVVAVILAFFISQVAPDAMGVFVIVGMVVSGFSYLPMTAVASEAKQVVGSALCGPLGVTFEAVIGDPPPIEYLRTLHLLPQSNEDSFEDRFRGRRAGCVFELFEARLVHRMGKNSSTVFQGQLFAIDYPKRFLGRTVVLRDSGWMNRFRGVFGLEKVSLEDPVFEKTFEVYGSDQVEARAILTPDFMEKLRDLDVRFCAQTLRCAFVDGRVLIALEGPIASRSAACSPPWSTGAVSRAWPATCRRCSG